MLDEILTYLGEPGFGVVHTSNFAYQFHNLSHYNTEGFPYHPNASDFALATQQSRSWAAFANFGTPSLEGKGTLPGWTPAFAHKGEIDLYIIGGAREGLFAEDGPRSDQAVEAQKLRERCGFLNLPEIIEQLDY